MVNSVGMPTHKPSCRTVGYEFGSKNHGCRRRNSVPIVMYAGTGTVGTELWRTFGSQMEAGTEYQPQ